MASEKTISARRAVSFVSLVLGTAAILDSGPMLAAAQALGGVEGAIATAIARPVDSLARVTHLNEPREALLAALGRPVRDAGTVSELGNLAAALPAPTPSKTAAARTPQPIGLPPLRTPTAVKPLRVLITGDSLSQYLGQQFIQLTAHSKKVVGKIAVRNGTGLARPDIFDWAKGARTAVSQARPDVVIVALGANDDQGIALPGPRALQVGGNEWAQEYSRRAEVVMKILLGKGQRRVYWMGLPVVRDAKMDREYRALNEALKTAASHVPGVRYVDTRAVSLLHGKFSDYLYDSGKRILARQPDGIHFTYEGSKIPAEKVLETAAPEMHLPVLPKPSPPKPKPPTTEAQGSRVKQ